MMRRGLTLLELVIVLAVLVVLAALATPGLASRLRHERLLGAAEALAADIAQARHEAARRGSALHIEAHRDGAQWCWSVATHAGCPCDAGVAAPADMVPGGPEAAPCRLKIVRAAEHPGVGLAHIEPVRIGADGQSSVAVAAAFVAGERQLQVQVSRFGRTRVCDPQGHNARVPRC